MLPWGWGHPFFRLPALWLVPDRGVGTSSSGLQKWIPPRPLTSGEPGYVSGVFNTARFLAPIVGRIANAYPQEENVHSRLTMHGTLAQRGILAHNARYSPRCRGFLRTLRHTCPTDRASREVARPRKSLKMDLQRPASCTPSRSAWPDQRTRRRGAFNHSW